MRLVTQVILVCVGVLKWQQPLEWILRKRTVKGHPCYRDLVTNIPEFNPEFLKATKEIRQAGLDFWWENEDTQSRLKAFGVLKDLYKEKVGEFEY